MFFFLISIVLIVEKYPQSAVILDMWIKKNVLLNASCVPNHQA